MSLDRRDFLKVSAGAAGATILAFACSTERSDRFTSISKLRPMTDNIIPISDDERRARMEKARRLMIESKIDAIYLEAGASLFYFTGIRWGISERMFAAILPARGELTYICPKFEEDRARELIRFGDDVRTWEEHESPYKRVAQIFKDQGIKKGTIGIEERVRFFLFDGIRKEAPGLEYMSADPITIPCRVIKSPQEIALMQIASDITIKAYKASVALLEKGMTKDDFREISTAAHRALGVSGGIGCQIAEASSQPHGSIRLIELKEGDIVLMDGGCGVDGYRSDISRTIVFGEPTKRQRDIWNLASRAKAAAFAAAGVGVPCEDVDAAARQVHIDYGFGPGYKLPGCSHRTGHGIGLNGHEWINLVKGNKTPMEIGMCFSNEPMVIIPGEFGVRLEDCMYITNEGPKYFSGPSPSIEQPFI